MCAEEDMPVVISMLSLPGSRWLQNNNEKDDLRIWKSEAFQKQAIKFWQDLSLELKDHPAIVGYNILNEPHPEKIKSFNSKKIEKVLNNFYKDVINAIRSVDSHTPIILDSSEYGDPKTFKLLHYQNDDKIIYSLHMYEPYEYTNLKINNNRFSYPGQIKGKLWNKEVLNDYMQAVLDFQKKHNIPSSRILVGEFGGNRMSKGLDTYFRDLIEIFNANGWHHAFYAFREDTWEGMDFELGDQKLSWDYWKAIDMCKKPELTRYLNNPVFTVLKENLK